MANFCCPNPFLSTTAVEQLSQQQYEAYYPPTHDRCSDQLPLQLSNQRWYQRQKELKLKQDSDQLIQQALQQHHEEEMKYRNNPFSKENNTMYYQGYHTTNDADDADDDSTHQRHAGCLAKVLLVRTPMEIHNLYEDECGRRGESSGKKTECMMMLTLLLAVIIVAATGGGAFPVWSMSSPSSSSSSDRVTTNDNDNIILSGMEEIVMVVGIKDGVVGMEDVVLLVSEKVENDATIIIDTGNKEDIIDTEDKEDTGATTMWADIMCIIRLLILALCLRYVDKKWNESDDDDNGYDYDVYDYGCNTLYHDYDYVYDDDDENDTTSKFSMKTMMGMLNINY